MMKKIALLLTAMALVFGASARVINNPRPINNHKNNTLVKPGSKAQKHKRDTRLNYLTSQPAGQLKTYKRSGCAIYTMSGGINMGYQNGNMNVVFAADGTVYVQNILYGTGNYYGDYWIEGTLDGNEIHIPMGQSIFYSDYYGADIVLAWGTTYIYNNGDGATLGFDADPDVDEVIYTIDGDSMYMSYPQGIAPVDNGDDYWNFIATGLGCKWTDDDSFGGALEWETIFKEKDATDAPKVITEQPEGELYSYTRRGDCIYSSIWGIYHTQQSGKLNVVFGDDGKAYIQNPIYYCEGYDTWVEGSYDPATDIISIPTGQYLTWDSSAEYGIQLMWGSTYVYENEDGDYALGYTVDRSVDEIQFLIDGNTITLLGCEGDFSAEYPYNYNATGMMAVYSDTEDWITIEFNTYGETFNLEPAIPSDPIVSDWYDCGDESGFSRLSFELPTTDIYGNPINQEYLSYSVYTDDDQLFTFDTYTYGSDLAEDMTEIPYSVWNSGYDFHKSSIYFYRTNNGWNGELPLFYYQIGLQVHYTVSGITNSSNICYYSIGGGGWTNNDELKTAKTIATQRYYNMTGQEVSSPIGLTIQVTTYTDGTTVATKVVK